MLPEVTTALLGGSYVRVPTDKQAMHNAAIETDAEELVRLRIENQTLRDEVSPLPPS